MVRSPLNIVPHFLDEKRKKPGGLSAARLITIHGATIG